MKILQRERKIALKDFWGKGKHVYDDELGWTLADKQEAQTLVSRELFRYHVEEVGLNLSFYDPVTDNFYGIHRECYPIECKILPRNINVEFIGWQCPGDTHPDGTVLASFEDEKDIWDNFKINGNSLEEVINRSYIIGLN